MKAVVYHRYGPPEVLQVQETAKPTVKADQVLVKVHATTVTAGDWRMRKPDPFLVRMINGLFKPRRFKILGNELAGTIEAVGEDVQNFKIGDEVYGFSGFGAYAEFRCVKPHKALAMKPKSLSFEEAAAIPVGANTALYYLRDKGKIKNGQKVLVYGASGSVGTYAIQLAKYFGAKVTGVCSTSNLKLVTSIGADKVIDYTKGDFTRTQEKFDIVFDAVGKTSKAACKKIFAPNAKYVTVNRGLARGKAANLIFLNGLIDSGELTPIIDKNYSLEQIVSAHHYVELGHKKGNVTITIPQN